MRPIPSSLLEKIKKQNQTIYENAEPHMSVSVARARSSIMDSTYFTVETIRQKEGLGDIALAIRRQVPYGYPDRIYEIHIDNGVAKTAYREYPDKLKEGWKTGFTLEAAKSVGIAFDCHWELNKRKRWQPVTDEKPYIFWVTTAGDLYVQMWDEMESRLKLAEDVIKCNAMRGWKNVYLWNHDQGIIVAYIKTDNKVYYRNYCKQPPDQPALWEIERVVNELPNPAQNVSLFRTNDYRIGIMCESNGKLYWTITIRNWANMAIQPHYIGAGITDLKVNLIKIAENEYFDRHNISAAITDAKVMLCPALWPQVTKIRNIGENAIKIETDMLLYGDLEGLEDGFEVRDSINTKFIVIGTYRDDDKLILELENFASASGNLTVTYTHSKAPISSQVEGGCMMELPDFAIAFKPDIAPPEGYTDHNISVAITNVIVDLKAIEYTDLYSEHNIAVGITDLSVNLIHVDDINP